MATASIGAPQREPRRRFLGRPIPAEGADGLFTQSWFPLCRSSQVAKSQVLGVDFLLMDEWLFFAGRTAGPGF